MRRIHHYQRLLLATTVLGLAAPVSVFAADSGVAAASAGATATEVVITARKREETVQKVPLAVTALGAAALEQKAVASAADLQYHVPSLQENNGAYFLGAEPSFVLRGLSTTAPGTNADPSVASYFNEVPLLNTRQMANEFYDLASVQVLRGPQGTLFGKNSDGGAILFTPQRPTHRNEGFVQLEGGNYNQRQLTGAVNAALADNLDVRLSTRLSAHDGYIKNVSGAKLDTQNFQAGRFQVEYRPTEKLTNDLMVDGYHGHQNGTALVPTNFSAIANYLYGYSGQTGIPYFGQNPFTPLMTDPQYLAMVPIPLATQLANQKAWGPRKVSSPITNPITLDVYTISNITSYKLSDDLSLKNVLGYQHQRTKWLLSQANEPTPLLVDDFRDTQDQLSDELQLQGRSFANRLDWILGAYYAHQDETAQNGNTILKPLIANQLNSTSKTDSTALFAQGTYKLDELLKGLEFTAGYRYSWDHKQQSASDTGTNIPAGIFVPSCEFPGIAPGAPCVRSLSKTFSSPNWTIGLDYHYTDKLMFYVASRKGYKAGGFNPTSYAPGSAAYGAETITDVEGGMKSQFTLGEAPGRLNLAIYHADYGNPTVAPVVPYFGNAVQVVENVHEGATINGGELEAALNPTRDLQLSFSYGLADAKFKSSAQFISGYTGSLASPVPVFTSLGSQPVPGSSKTTISASARYTLPLDDSLGKIAGEVDYSWRSAQTLAGFPVAHLPAFGVVNLKIDWTHVRGSNVDLSVWVKNLGDKLYVTNQQLLSAALGVDQNEYGPPLTFGVDLTYHW